ncbi:MAG: hypothetical protein ACK40H_03660 [Sphingomonadaceae bacterium]
MLFPAALLAASAVALSLGVAVCGDTDPATAPSTASASPRGALPAYQLAAQEALRACVRRGDQATESIRLALARRE